MTKQVYPFDPTTGEYLPDAPALETKDDGVEERTWTETPPPKTKAGYARLWNGNEWRYIQDHRGETWWNRDDQEVTVDFLDDPKLEKLSNVPPKTYYFHHGRTKEYLGEKRANRSPVNLDNFLIPANATDTKPLDPKEGHAVVWTGTAWAYEPDYRGETWYHGREPVRIETLGDPELKGLTKTKPPKPLDEVKRDAKAAVLGFADGILADLEQGYSQLEIKGWQEKGIEARAVVGGLTPTAVDTPLLWREAEGNMEALKALAPRVQAKAQAFYEVSGLASRMRSKTETAIDAAENAEAVAAIIEAAEADAKTKLSEFGIEFNSPTTHPTQGG